MRRCFYDIYVHPTSLQGDEKMKPIFSTEQARYQKFASFFIYALRVFRALRRANFRRRLSGVFIGTREKPNQKLGVAPKGHNSQFFVCFFFLRGRISLSAESDQGSAFGNRHLLKKVDENFLALV